MRKLTTQITCTGCGAIEHEENSWWNLNNYFGITGYFCPDCYDKVSHGSDKKPKNPEEYTFMLLRQQSKLK
jgi:uncharacterized protein YlaI